MSTASYIDNEFRAYIAAEAGDEVADSACRMLHDFVSSLRQSIRGELRGELQPQLDELQAEQDAVWERLRPAEVRLGVTRIGA